MYPYSLSLYRQPNNRRQDYIRNERQIFSAVVVVAYLLMRSSLLRFFFVPFSFL